MITGFVFDLDGVITDTAKYHYQAWYETAKDQLGIIINPSVNEQLKGRSRMDSLHAIIDFGATKRTYSEDELQKIASIKNERYRELIQNMSADDILPGIKEFLSNTRAANIPMAVASASKNAPTIINKLGLEQFLGKIVNPSDIKHGKPAPDIFLAAAALICSAPSTTIGFEDASAGIQGIKDAGMFAVGIGKREVLHHADCIFANTQQLSLERVRRAYAIR